MRVHVPSPSKAYRLDFPMLTGGLNTEELDYRLKTNESPYMKNLWWQDGVLQSRDGQRIINEAHTMGVGYCCFDRLWHGRMFAHIGTRIVYGVPTGEGMALSELASGVPENRGTFFYYYDWLFYKNRGGFYQITYNPDADSFSGKSVTDGAYVPIIQLNTNPQTGAGDGYQPENRLTPKMEVEFTAKTAEKVYHLPIKDIDSVDEITVDDVVLDPSKYTVDLKAGTITFSTPPRVPDPLVPNTVDVKFSKANPDALKSIMDCKYAFVSGGDRNICILLAGSTAQPNAVFWNANDDLSMNQSYWPFSAYNLVGPTNDPVVGFGQQYKDTIVFKEHSIGKLDFAIDEIDKRKIPLFTYTPVNDRIGCNLPWSIQLVKNNLVFANTYQGVHTLRSSSSAYENNVECISNKVNDPNNTSITDRKLPGLLSDVQKENVDDVASWDDDSRYWLYANGRCYVWDYTVSQASDPSWFLFTGVEPRCFFADDGHKSYHINKNGDITIFERSFSDYGKAIDKVYQFPVTDFGVVSNLKDVVEAMFVTRSETETKIGIEYRTDLETREDLTDIQTWSWTWDGLNLAKTILGYYNLKVPRYGTIVKRRPMCKHIRYFTMTLSNNVAGSDLAIVSAQVYYRLSGKER